MPFAALDIHLKSVEAVLLDDAGALHWRGQFPATRAALLAFARRHRVALEATFHSWAIAELTQPFVAEVVVSNPLRTRAIAEAKIKTDRVDATVPAHLLRPDYLPRVWQPDADTRHLRHLAFLEREIALQRQTLCRQAYEDPRVKLLMTLPAVDFSVAQALLAALGDVNRFATPEQAAAYLGLVPSTRQSAEHCYHGPITKQGRAHSRWLLVEAAHHLDRHPGPLGVFFRRLAHPFGGRIGRTPRGRAVAAPGAGEPGRAPDAGADRDCRVRRGHPPAREDAARPRPGVRCRGAARGRNRRNTPGCLTGPGGGEGRTPMTQQRNSRKRAEFS